MFLARQSQRLRRTGASVIDQVNYAFNSITGNLTSRNDISNSRNEVFAYDNLNRLTGINGLTVGTEVIPGQLIGNVVDVKAQNTMLHFEMYDGTATGLLTNKSNLPFMRRHDLMNPTNYLLRLRVR